MTQDESSNKKQPDEELSEESSQPDDPADEPVDSNPEDESDSQNDSGTNDEPEVEPAPDETDLALTENAVEPAPVKTRKRSRGFFDFLLVLLIAALAGGEYILFQKQKAHQALVLDRLARIDQGLSEVRGQGNASASDEMGAALNDLKTQVQALNGQLNTSQNQQAQTIAQLKEEIEQLQASPPPEQETEPVEVEEEPEDSEEPEQPEEAPPAEDRAEESESAAPEDRFVHFVEAIAGVVIEGVKQGATFVWDTVEGWLNQDKPSPSK